MREQVKTKQQPSKKLMRRLENIAFEIRAKAGTDRWSPFDPFANTGPLNITIMQSADVEGAESELQDFISSASGGIWSAGMLDQKLPDGTHLVLVNSNITKERARVSILEEVVHAYLNHKPSIKTKARANGTGRDYEAFSEQEAYWTAAAILLPMSEVAKAVWSGKPAEELGRNFYASKELADMRIKTLGLWNEYKERNKVG